MRVRVLTLALLICAVGCTWDPFRDVDRVPTVRAQISALNVALDAYKYDVGEYPPTTSGLAALRTDIGNKPGWNGPYLSREIPLDPWGQPYIYRLTVNGAPDIKSSREE